MGALGVGRGGGRGEGRGEGWGREGGGSVCGAVLSLFSGYPMYPLYTATQAFLNYTRALPHANMLTAVMGHFNNAAMCNAY